MEVEAWVEGGADGVRVCGERVAGCVGLADLLLLLIGRPGRSIHVTTCQVTMVTEEVCEMVRLRIYLYIYRIHIYIYLSIR